MLSPLYNSTDSLLKLCRMKDESLEDYSNLLLNELLTSSPAFLKPAVAKDSYSILSFSHRPIAMPHTRPLLITPPSSHTCSLLLHEFRIPPAFFIVLNVPQNPLTLQVLFRLLLANLLGELGLDSNG